ncbi:MAG: NmrA family NAD(P)-binding protein [Niabella sp.]
MDKTILIAGATGNLGNKIVRALLNEPVSLRVLVRQETNSEKVRSLEQSGLQVVKVASWNKDHIAEACSGAACIVSALSGLRDTVIEAQTALLDGAVLARVPRFIPSDYSIDFTNLKEGRNRNLDLRRAFHRYLDHQNIQVTTIFNGAFMELLTTDMPLILSKINRILCWGNPDQLMEFTLTDDVARFTAKAVLDDDSPRYLKIAGDCVSCNHLVQLLTEVTGKKYKLLKPGGISLLNKLIRITQLLSPSRKKLYPAWQGMQYMRDMMEGRVMISSHDNDKYGALPWTRIKEFLKSSNKL